MKSIDVKSMIIGFLLCAVVFLTMGLANQAVQEVRIVGIDHKGLERWEAINTK